MSKSTAIMVLGLSVIILLGSFLVKTIYQPETFQKITSKLEGYSKQYAQQKVYLHTDKTKYNVDERIWIKAYLVEASSLRPDHSDNNLYIELINPSGYIVQTKVVRIEEGLGHCDFSFQDTIPEGFYRLRAYTNWMRNVGNEFFFNKDIYITNPLFKTYATREAVIAVKKSLRKNSRKEARYDVTFHPEGGHLLSDVQNRVAFKAINELGTGIEIEGILKDKRGKTVLNFSSSHLGMGSFNFTPEKGNNYTADVNNSDMKDMSFKLPDPIDKGINISAVHQQSTLRINIITNLNSGSVPPNPVYYFLAHVRGKPFYSTEVDIRNKENLTFDIPKKNFPTGVVHLTLFNTIPAPVSERLVFINHEDVLNVDIAANNSNFAPRQKILLKINISDHSGNPVKSDFSLSAADEESSDFSSGIVSHLFLASDLMGHIENPNYYFSNSTGEKVQDLDYLMMTQGWRRFKWSEVLADKRPPVKFNKENSLEISGKITRDFFSLPLKDINVTLTILDQFNDVFQTRSDQDGDFRFTNLHYQDTINVRIEARRPSGRKNLVILVDDMNRPKLKDINYKTYQEISKPGPKGRWITSQEPEEEDPYKDLNTNRNRIHSIPRDVIIIDETLESYQNILQIIQGRVPGVDVVGDRVIIRGISTIYGSTDPLFLVDDIPVDPEYALALTPLDVERIEILKGPDAAIYGVRGANGVIAIYTRRGKFMVRGQVDFKMLGYAIPSEFYSPKYEANVSDPFIDDRRTLIWIPNVVSDSIGNAEISFHASDIPGKYLIRMEGISKDGVPGIGQIKIEVK